QFIANPTASANPGSLAVTNQGTILDVDLTSLNGVNVTLDGTGTLATNQWATLTGSNLTITGGSYTFPGLIDIDSSSLSVQAGAVLTLPALNSSAASGASVTVSDGASLDFGGNVVNMPSTGSGAAINVPQLPQGLTVNLGSSGTLVGATFNIAEGDTVNLSSGTYVGAVFNVAQGATVDLTGGQTVTYSGTLTGSGSGTVQFSSGTL